MTITQELAKMGITKTCDVQTVAVLILAACHDSKLQNEALEITQIPQNNLKERIQRSKQIVA